MEGRLAGRRRAIDIARTDIPTARPEERLSDVAARAREQGQAQVVVVGDDGVVFGRLRKRHWQIDPGELVEEVMELGPSTIRPDLFLHDVHGRFRPGAVENLVVTSNGSEPDGGRYLGLLFREDVERTLAENEDP